MKDKLNTLVGFNDFEKSLKEAKKTKRTETGLDVIKEKKSNIKPIDVFLLPFYLFEGVYLFERIEDKGRLFERKGREIYHFTESLDSLSDILSDDTLMSGEKTNYGRGYENISFTWNPNLWDIEYMGDNDYRYKVKMCFDYDRMSKEWKFEPYDYFSEKELEQDPQEQEERVITDEMNGIIKYITKIYISSEYVKGDMEWLKNRYPNIKFHWARRKKFKTDSDW